MGARRGQRVSQTGSCREQKACLTCLQSAVGWGSALQGIKLSCVRSRAGAVQFKRIKTARIPIGVGFGDAPDALAAAMRGTPDTMVALYAPVVKQAGDAPQYDAKWTVGPHGRKHGHGSWVGAASPRGLHEAEGRLAWRWRRRCRPLRRRPTALAAGRSCRVAEEVHAECRGGAGWARGGRMVGAACLPTRFPVWPAEAISWQFGSPNRRLPLDAAAARALLHRWATCTARRQCWPWPLCPATRRSGGAATL